MPDEVLPVSAELPPQIAPEPAANVAPAEEPLFDDIESGPDEVAPHIALLPDEKPLFDEDPQFDDEFDWPVDPIMEGSNPIEPPKNTSPLSEPPAAAVPTAASFGTSEDAKLFGNSSTDFLEDVNQEIADLNLDDINVDDIDIDDENLFD